MGKRGRKTTPTKLKVLKGTLEKSRVVPNEMTATPLPEIPKPPTYLDKKGKDTWKICCSALIRVGLLYLEDLNLLEQFSYYVSVSAKCKKQLKKEDLIVWETNVKGAEYSTKNKLFSLMIEADKQIIKLSQEFGFSPSARTKISMPGKNNALDKEMFG